MDRMRFSFVFSFLIILILLSTGCGVFFASTGDELEVKNTNLILSLSDHFITDKLQLCIIGIETCPSSSFVYDPESGYTLLVIRVNIKNEGSETESYQISEYDRIVNGEKFTFSGIAAIRDGNPYTTPTPGDEETFSNPDTGVAEYKLIRKLDIEDEIEIYPGQEADIYIICHIPYEWRDKNNLTIELPGISQKFRITPKERGTED